MIDAKTYILHVLAINDGIQNITILPNVCNDNWDNVNGGASKVIMIDETKATILNEIPNSKWRESNLNINTPVVEEVIDGIKYYAPIPKGFSVSQAVGENAISTGLLIYDNRGIPEKEQVVTDENVLFAKEERNQFVWVPVNNSYNVLGDSNANGIYKEDYHDNTNLDNNSTSALQYWKNKGIGVYSGGWEEPYPDIEYSWSKEEWDNMYESVMLYGGFYVGRYETGNNGEYNVNENKWSSTTPVVVKEANVWNNIPYNNDFVGKPQRISATNVSRNMYKYDDTNYGATSTLIYGIQWDSLMGWANCSTKVRMPDTYLTNETATKTGEVYKDGVNYDVEKNIYDLAGNVKEWSMERFEQYRVIRSGYYKGERLASQRSHHDVNEFHTRFGFRISLYIK